MAKIAVAFGVVLVLLGIGGFVAGFVVTGAAQFTALIPAAVGGLLIVLGVLAFRENRRKHAMHAAAAVGLLGFLLAGGRLVSTWVSGTPPKPAAAVTLWVMAIACAAFVGLCINSFIAARRARAQSEKPAGTG